MQKQIRGTAATVAFSLILGMLPLAGARAEDTIEKAGIGVGLTIGNVLFLPVKAVSVSMGLITSSASLILSGGNGDLSEQILRDTTAEPYLITPELAKKAVGQRPELLEKK